MNPIRVQEIRELGKSKLFHLMGKDSLFSENFGNSVRIKTYLSVPCAQNSEEKISRKVLLSGGMFDIFDSHAKNALAVIKPKNEPARQMINPGAVGFPLLMSSTKRATANIRKISAKVISVPFV